MSTKPKYYIVESSALPEVFLKVAEAKRLLIQTEDKITEIAKQVGFENDKHFMKSFKTACGVSPSEFRKDYKMVSNGKGGQDE